MSDFEELEKRCKECKGCALAETRLNVVFGAGNSEAEILFVGEGPGADEDLKGQPFVGRAGRLLDDMLKIIGLSRDKNIYIANIVKCRPPGNRDPRPDERAACSPWLNKQIELIKPKIIVCLGRIAAAAMISENYKITRDHGSWHDYAFSNGSAKITAIYHPAALLRDQYKKPDTFADLKGIEKMINDLGIGF